jgi:HPt (histidine-containing phosphotransfer) domain-containing protein
MDYAQMMAELKSEYITSMPEKILEIKRHFESNDADLLRDDFHKLKGTGKTYGIPEISELSAVVEELCIQKKWPLKQYVSVAINLLEKIYTAQKSNQSYPVTNLEEFIALKKLV